MGMLGYPLLHFDIQPKGVNAKGDDGQQKPLDIVSEKLATGAVKPKLSPIYHRMPCYPGFLQTDGPWRRNAKGKHNQQPLQNADADQPQKPAGKFRFHWSTFLSFRYLYHSSEKMSNSFGVQFSRRHIASIFSY